MLLSNGHIYLCSTTEPYEVDMFGKSELLLLHGKFFVSLLMCVCRLLLTFYGTNFCGAFMST